MINPMYRTDTVRDMSPKRRNCLTAEDTNVDDMNVHTEVFDSYKKVVHSAKDFSLHETLNSFKLLLKITFFPEKLSA